MIAHVMPIATALLVALRASAIDASVFALIVVVANRIAKPGAATRHVLFSFVLAVAVAAPLASFLGSLARIETVAPKPIAAASATHSAAGGALSSSRAVAKSHVPQIEITIPRSLVVFGALGIWLAVASLRGATLAIELVSLRRVKQRARTLDRANGTTIRAATIAVSEDVDVPCAAGFRTPAILLPASIAATALPDDIDRIVMHESAHLARYDDWTNLLERICATLLWFNPAIAFARRRIALDREIACDDWVVARIGGAHAYASCLFRLAQAVRGARPTTHAVGALGAARQTAGRIERLLSLRREASRRVARGLTAIVATCACTLTIAQAAFAPAIAVPGDARAAIGRAPRRHVVRIVSRAAPMRVVVLAPRPVRSRPTVGIAPAFPTPARVRKSVIADAKPTVNAASRETERAMRVDRGTIRAHERATADGEAAEALAEAMRERDEALREAALAREEGLREARSAREEGLREAARARAEALGEAQIERRQIRLERDLERARIEMERERVREAAP